MAGGQTKNSALSTALAFHYQVLIGLEKCFTMKEGQSVWFERDGDVSLISDSIEDSTQVEIKKYVDSLTDNHENFWNTLKNWLASDFNHKNYSSLVLHTTQAFGSRTSFKNWNMQNSDQRLQILKGIYSKRTMGELSAEKPKTIVQLQKTVMSTEEEKLKEVLAKVVLFTEADDEESVAETIQSRLTGIPKSNQQSYKEGLVGFVYESSHSTQWEISKSAFDSKNLELTSRYCLRQFTFPPFTGREATEEELTTHEEKLFVQKIQDIDYDEEIPDAIGNWIELHNSLDAELEGAPQFRNVTNRYQAQLVKQFNRKYKTKQRNCTNIIRDSKDLYDDMTGETPASMEEYQSPPIEYRNGLLHDVMDDDTQNLKWRVEP